MKFVKRLRNFIYLSLFCATCVESMFL